MSRKQIKEDFKNILLPVPYIRALTFIIFMAFNLTTGFLPIYAGRFNAELWGVAPEICAALPLVANQIMIAISALFCGGLVKRTGIRKVLPFGTILCAAGEIINAAAPSFAVFMAGMSITGFGAGLIFSCINIYIASISDVGHKEEGFKFFNSASFSGMNCGILIGASLAVFIGQASVFYVAAGVWFISMCVFIALANRNVPKITVSGEKQSGLFKFLASRGVLITLLYLLSYVTIDGFLNFFVPVFGAELGMPETEISLLFILHAVSVILIGPGIVKKLKRNETETAGILGLSMVMSVAALLITIYNPTILFVSISVLILGCSNSLGYTYGMLYFSELKAAKEQGADKTMPVYGAVANMGYAAGPFIFGAAMTAGIAFGFGIISAVAGGVGFLFFTAAKRAKRKDSGKNM
jgi:predicted MFS family arabinose efflux permease